VQVTARRFLLMGAYSSRGRWDGSAEIFVLRRALSGRWRKYERCSINAFCCVACGWESVARRRPQRRGEALSSGEIFGTPAAAFSTVDSSLKVAAEQCRMLRVC